MFLLFAYFILANSGSLEVTINNVIPDQGKVKIAVHETKKSFPANDENAYYVEEFDTEAKDRIIVSMDLEYGEYAITVFQDINSNGKLDKGFLGIPKEPWVCSGKRSIGPPSFEHSKFIIDSDTVKITVALRD